jgi:hypothetical protein
MRKNGGAHKPQKPQKPQMNGTDEWEWEWGVGVGTRGAGMHPVQNKDFVP